MQILLEHFHPTFYPLHTSNRCYPTLKSLLQPPGIYQCHVRQFLLLIDVPIQDQTQQISIYRIFTLDIPHGNFPAHYEIDTKYLRITWDETMALEISDKQYSTCKEANGQFCIYTPFQPLANLTSCITALYSKNANSIAARCSLQVRKVQTISIPMLIAPNLWFSDQHPLQ